MEEKTTRRKEETKKLLERIEKRRPENQENIFEKCDIAKNFKQKLYRNEEKN